MTKARKVSELDIYIQEAFYRGWCFGFQAGNSGVFWPKGSGATTEMIADYKAQKRGIKTAVRESLKRVKPKGKKS